MNTLSRIVNHTLVAILTGIFHLRLLVFVFVLSMLCVSEKIGVGQAQAYSN